MHGQTKISPKSWLAFDLNVLRRLTFSSVALPFAEQTALGAYLKRWNAGVSANDPLQFAYIRALCRIQNHAEKLEQTDVDTVLEDAYVPGYRPDNEALVAWFGETDAWWFDNVKRNIDRLQTPVKKALASTIVLATGDYALSFDKDTRELRQPLSNVFRRLWTVQPSPIDNGRDNPCSNRIADDFVAETQSDLMFLRLPHPHAHTHRTHLGRAAWREEWIRGGDSFWPELEGQLHGRLGAATETKSQYLHLLEETLRRASHIKKWAIAHIEDGFIQTQDIADTIASIRRVDTVFTKDFSELTGTKAVIITA